LGAAAGGSGLGLSLGAAGALQAGHVTGRQGKDLDTAVGSPIGEHHGIRPELVLQHAKGLAGGFGKVALDVHAPVSGYEGLAGSARALR
jgi:hypothetical protein